MSIGLLCHCHCYATAWASKAEQKLLHFFGEFYFYCYAMSTKMLRLLLQSLIVGVVEAELSVMALHMEVFSYIEFPLLV